MASGVFERNVGVEYWSGMESNFGVENWAANAIHSKPGHVLEKTKNINFHSADVGVNSYQI